jgi:hypothetical protein
MLKLLKLSKLPKRLGIGISTGSSNSGVLLHRIALPTRSRRAVVANKRRRTDTASLQDSLEALGKELAHQICSSPGRYRVSE